MPATFERHRMGPLAFEVIRNKGLVGQVRITAWDPRRGLNVLLEPRLQPLDVTLTKIPATGDLPTVW